MRSDQEFLDGMWQKVSILEREELEKANIRELNKKLTNKSVKIAAFSIFAFLILILLSKFISEAVYPITFSILFIAFVYETLSNKVLEEKKYAN
jgi:hypothetical protein